MHNLTIFFLSLWQYRSYGNWSIIARLHWLLDNWNRHNEKVLRETQTLCTGCSKVEPKIFAPPQTPFPGARDGRNLISWRWSLPLPTSPVWWRSMHATSSYRGNRPTHTQTQTPTHKHTGPITIHCAAANGQCNKSSLPLSWNNTCLSRLIEKLHDWCSKNMGWHSQL